MQAAASAQLRRLSTNVRNLASKSSDNMGASYHGEDEEEEAASDEDDDDYLDDDPDVPKMEGQLMEKDWEEGEWDQRYGILQRELLLLYRPEGIEMCAELVETVDTRQIADLICADGLMQLILPDQPHPTILCGPAIEEWNRALSAAMEMFGDQGLLISGWLLKCSLNGSKHQPRERYVRVTGHYLRYFKGEGIGETELGSLNLRSIQHVVPVTPNDPECKTFEVLSEHRLFVFEAGCAEDLALWVQTLERGHRAALEAEERKKRLRYEEKCPIRIRIFDEKGKAAFVELITSDLEEIYPADLLPPPTADDAVAPEGASPASPGTLAEPEGGILPLHISHATDVVDYLVDFIPETQKIEGVQAARFDVLSAALAAVNAFLSARMLPLFSSDSGVSGKSSRQSIVLTVLDQAKLSEVHSLILWISKFQQVLGSIHCPVPPDSAAHENPFACRLLDAIPLICHVYVNGSDALPTSTGAGAHLTAHCLGTWGRLLKSPADSILRHQDASFYTQAPVDMWRAANQHIQLASRTGSSILHVLVADKIAQVVKGVTRRISDYVSGSALDDDARVREVEVELLCALANDNALHIEEVMATLETFDDADVRSRVDAVYDSVTMALVKCGQACLKRLAKVVLCDVEEQLAQVFTPPWLEDGSQIHTSVATVDDYLRDLSAFLMPFWNAKFNVILLEAMAVRYAQAVLFRTSGNQTRFSLGAAHSSLRRIRAGVTVGGMGIQIADEDEIEDSSGLANSAGSGSSSSSTMSWALRSMGMGASLNMLSRKASPMSSSGLSPAASSQGGSSPSRFVTPAKDRDSLDTRQSMDGHVPVDSESLGRLAQDTAKFNNFFSKHVSAQDAGDILFIINELSAMLALPVNLIIQHAVTRMDAYPLAAQAVCDVATACMKCKGVPRLEIVNAYAKLQLCVAGARQAVALAREKERKKGLGRPSLLTSSPSGNTNNSTTRTPSSESDSGASAAENEKLGLLYLELVPDSALSELDSDLGLSPVGGRESTSPDSGVGRFSERLDSAASLAQRMKDIANINLDQLKEHALSSPNRRSVVRGKDAQAEAQTVGLVRDVLHTLAQQEKRRLDIEAAESREHARAAEILTSSAGVLNLRGWLDRKVPSAVAWKRSWMQLSSRANKTGGGDADGADVSQPYTYTLMWSFEQGGKVMAAFSVESIHCLRLMESPLQPHSAPVELVFSEEEEVCILASDLPQEKLDVIDDEYSDCFLVTPLRREQQLKDAQSGAFEGSPAHGSGSAPGSRLGPGGRETGDGEARRNRHFIFHVLMVDGSRHEMRTMRAARALKWINGIAAAAGLSYDNDRCEWNREARILLKSHKVQLQAELEDAQRAVEEELAEQARRAQELVAQQQRLQQLMQQQQEASDKRASKAIGGVAARQRRASVGVTSAGAALVTPSSTHSTAALGSSIDSAAEVGSRGVTPNSLPPSAAATPLSTPLSLSTPQVSGTGGWGAAGGGASLGSTGPGSVASATSSVNRSLPLNGSILQHHYDATTPAAPFASASANNASSAPGNGGGARPPIQAKAAAADTPVLSPLHPFYSPESAASASASASGAGAGTGTGTGVMDGKHTPSHSLDHIARMPSPSASPAHPHPNPHTAAAASAAAAGRQDQGQSQGQGQLQVRRPLEVEGGQGHHDTTIEEQVQLWLDRHCGCLC